jgi:hypothetical protein
MINAARQANALTFIMGEEKIVSEAEEKEEDIEKKEQLED